MKKTKIIVSILLIVCALFAFVACGKLPNGDDAGNNNTTGGGDNGNGEVDNSAYQVDEATWETIFADTFESVDNATYVIYINADLNLTGEITEGVHRYLLNGNHFMSETYLGDVLDERTWYDYKNGGCDIYFLDGNNAENVEYLGFEEDNEEINSICYSLQSLAEILSGQYSNAVFDSDNNAYVYTDEDGTKMIVKFENDLLISIKYVEFETQTQIVYHEITIGNAGEIEIPQID